MLDTAKGADSPTGIIKRMDVINMRKKTINVDKIRMIPFSSS
jgi:hypothetical protein